MSSSRRPKMVDQALWLMEEAIAEALDRVNSTMQALADTDPWRLQKARSRTCRYCDHNSDNWCIGEHDDSCPWVLARQLVDEQSKDGAA